MARGYGNGSLDGVERPGRTVDKVDYTEDDDDLEIDEAYFMRTYRPLSNLPTPPPSSRHSAATQSPKSLLEDGESLQACYLGPAIHLCNLIPPAASLMTPSVPLVHAILSRANLPLDTVALAVCILDSLDRRFALSWRLACPPGRAPDEEQTPPPPAAAVPGQRPLAGQRLASPTCSPSSPVFAHTHMRCRSDFVTSPFSSSATAFDQQHRQHIDRVPPEIIIVAALVLAVKFLDDTRDPATAYYGREWGRGMWTCAQINATERCIMACLGYRIMPLWDAELIRDARRDMERAAEEARREEAKAARRGCGMRETLGKRVALGLATPEHTPVEEEAKQLAMPASGVA